MKITRVYCRKEDLKLTKPYTIAYRTINAVENLFVYIETDNGNYGLGAGSPAAFVTGEAMDTSLAALQQVLEEQVNGKDVRTYRAILRQASTYLAQSPAALAALDMALHDLLAKQLDIPLVKLLGQVHHTMYTSVTIGIMSIAESVAAAKAYVAEGFQILKLKTGNSVEKDIEVCTKIREAIGLAPLIRVDANQGYDADAYAQFLKEADRLNIEFVEQPLPRGHFHQLLSLSKKDRKKAAADEDLHHPKDALELLRAGWPYGIFNIKLMKCGGILPALQIAELAHLSGVELMWGCMDESVVSISAALHTAFACPATRYLDLDGSFDLAKDLATGGFVLKDGKLHLTDAPGLGVRLIEKL